MVYLVYKSLIINETINVKHYLTVYSNVVNWNALSNTMQVSIYSTVLAVLISFPSPGLSGGRTCRERISSALYLWQHT